MPRYLYEHYQEIPEGVRREFTVDEIIELELCPPETCPPSAHQTQAENDFWNRIPMMDEPAECVVCGVTFRRKLFPTELPPERVTCGSIQCISEIMDWIGQWEGLTYPKTKSNPSSEDKLLTFLNSDLYLILRLKFRQSKGR